MTETAPSPAPYDFRAGTEPLAMLGLLRPVGRRILCRAILSTDGAGGGLAIPLLSAAEAQAFVVVAKGGLVDKVWAEELGEDEPLKLGDVVEIRSVAGDRVNPLDPTGRYWLVEVGEKLDVAARTDGMPLWSDELKQACAYIDERQSLATAANAHMPGNGEAQLEPMRRAR